MAANSASDDTLKHLEALLAHPQPHQAGIPAELADDLLRKGALLALQEQASPDAIRLLGEVARSSPQVATRNFAVRALGTLASAGHTEAIDQMYRLALLDVPASARQWVAAAGWKPSKPALKALFDWLFAVQTGREPHAELAALSAGFLEEADSRLQATITALAGNTPYRNWARLMPILAAPSGKMRELVDLFPSLSQPEQAICLHYLEQLATGDAEVQQAICRLFIEHDDHAARDLALRRGYLPEQPYERAMFLFLVGDQSAYQEIDFNHSLLVSAYESGSRALRRRLLAFSRQTGQIDWLSAIKQVSEVRWLADLSGKDWELAVHNLLDQQRYAELWRLAQAAPPVWSAGILARLAQTGWLPDSPSDQEGFVHLAQAATECLKQSLTLEPAASVTAPNDDILSLAFHPDASLLAAGTTGQPVYMWRLPEGNIVAPPLAGPAAATRAMLFSPEGELLITAAGDQRIRLVRHNRNQIIKTLEGHHGLIRALALHPNGRILASAGFDGEVHFWRFPIGTPIKTVFNPVREIFAARMLSAGDLLATGGAGDQVTLWSTSDGSRVRSLPVNPSGLLHLAAAPGSDLLAVAERSQQIIIWNAANGNLVHQLPTQEQPIAGLEFHPNEHLLISAGQDGLVRLWDANSGGLLFTFQSPHRKVAAVTLSPSGQWLATAGQDGRICVWNLDILIWLHTPYQPGSNLPLEHVSELMAAGTHTAEKSWLAFIDSLWKWVRRYEIEISEPMKIPIGEFDIEL